MGSQSGVDGCAAERKREEDPEVPNVEVQGAAQTPRTVSCYLAVAVFPGLYDLFRHPSQEEPPGLPLLTRDQDRLCHSQPHKRFEHKEVISIQYTRYAYRAARSIYNHLFRLQRTWQSWGLDHLAMETYLKLEVPLQEPSDHTPGWLGLWARLGWWVPTPGLCDGQLCYYTIKPCK